MKGYCWTLVGKERISQLNLGKKCLNKERKINVFVYSNLKVFDFMLLYLMILSPNSRKSQVLVYLLLSMISEVLSG